MSLGSEIEVDWALKQLKAAGYLEKAGEELMLTEAGAELARAHLWSFDIQTRLLIALFCVQTWPEGKN